MNIDEAAWQEAQAELASLREQVTHLLDKVEMLSDLSNCALMIMQHPETTYAHPTYEAACELVVDIMKVLK